MRVMAQSDTDAGRRRPLTPRHPREVLDLRDNFADLHIRHVDRKLELRRQKQTRPGKSAGVC